MNYRKIINFIKNLFLRLISKKTLIGIIIFLLFLLLINSNVFAVDNNVIDLPSEVYNALEDIPQYNNDNYYYCVFNNNGSYVAHFIDKSVNPNIKCYITNMNTFVNNRRRYSITFNEQPYRLLVFI